MPLSWKNADMTGLKTLNRQAMSYEKDYIDIFEQHRTLIDENCAELLNSKRNDAFEKFKTCGFPTTDNEEYRHSDVAKLFATDYGMNLGRLNIQTTREDLFVCDVPNLNTRQEFIVNDTYLNQENRESATQPGVFIGSLNEFAHTHNELITPYYNSLAQQGDSIAQFNTAFTQDGLCLYIPKDTELAETIQLVTILHSNIDILNNRRLLIILEEGAKANLLVCDHTSNEHKSLSTQVTEIFLKPGATLNMYELEDTDRNNGRLSQLFVQQENDSTFNHSCITLTNGFTRNAINVTLSGEGASANLSGLAICDKEQHTANRTLVAHKASHCNSNELYKYILDEESVGVFSGKMLIQPGAQHTNSQQTNRNLCLTSCARMYAQPQLEIYADDVKCSHGSTVGQLDENALFYMQQRGIPKEEARHLLMFAFAGEVIESISIDALRDRLHILIEKRFRGELNRCKGCSLCKK